MRLLLDTHIFLWFIAGSQKISAPLRADLQSTENDVYLSVVSIWEASIKYGLGKLALPESPGTYLPEQRERHGIASLVVDEKSVGRLDALPLLHRDPFDRLLVCQAIEYGLKLVTVDGSLQAYPVDVHTP